MNIFKKFTVLLTALCLLVVSLPFNKVQASEKLTPEQLFQAASNDTVVCYYMGKPVKKSQINADRTIKVSAINSIKSGNQISTRANNAETVTLTLPTKYNGAVVYQTVIAPRYSQKDAIMYFSKSEAIAFANRVSNLYRDTAISIGSLFLPFKGLENAPIALFIIVALASKAELANNIRSLTDQNYKVKVTSSTSSYGTFYGYERWSNSKIQYTTYNNNGNSMVLDSIYYHQS